MHSLEVIMFIALCTYLSGGEGFYDMQAYAQAREAWLRATVGMLSVPSHDTFNRIETSRRYYISSLPCDEAKVARSVRGHWRIENSLHWCLDVVFNEDQSRARARHAAKNLGTLRAICLN